MEDFLRTATGSYGPFQYNPPGTPFWLGVFQCALEAVERITTHVVFFSYCPKIVITGFQQRFTLLLSEFVWKIQDVVKLATSSQGWVGVTRTDLSGNCQFATV